MTHTESEREAGGPPAGTVLWLLVRNHPGVMSHICGLFARRAYNLEGILCLAVGDGRTSGMLLLLGDCRAPVSQVVLQLRKLEDVLEVAEAPAGRGAFGAVAAHVAGQTRGSAAPATSRPD